MGTRFCKNEVDGYEILPNPPRRTRLNSYNRTSIVKVVDTNVICRLEEELLTLITSFVDIDENIPVSLVKLHLIAEKDEGWFLMVTCLVNTIPLHYPLGPSAITVVFDECPLPSKSIVIKFTELYGLCAERARTVIKNVETERNLCVVLGCLADNLSGSYSVAILTENTLEYMVTILILHRDPRVTLFALVALEKFAKINENKILIMKKFAQQKEHPLLYLEKFSESKDYDWRQVGFCAKWGLDNIFVIEDRPRSYDIVDISNINAILKTSHVSDYLKISANGLEARCDSYTFETVRCSLEVNFGSWYYECLIITSGVMQIGWATKNSKFCSYEDIGIGDDSYSISYDGCRKLLWYKAKPTILYEVPAWKPGDILGCLLDIDGREIVFSLNGVRLQTCTEIFTLIRNGYYAAASFMTFQQCLFNFGKDPFRYPPKDRRFRCFNDYGYLDTDEKKMAPRRIDLQKCVSSENEDYCRVCYDKTSCSYVEPCKHNGFCRICLSRMNECPVCRGLIINIHQTT